MNEPIAEQTKQEIISEYMSALGKKGGNVNKRKGKDYFRWVRSHRKDEIEKNKEVQK